MGIFVKFSRLLLFKNIACPLTDPWTMGSLATLRAFCLFLKAATEDLEGWLCVSLLRLRGPWGVWVAVLRVEGGVSGDAIRRGELAGWRVP